MSESILEVKDLEFQYPDGTKALDQVSLRIERGKTLAVLGGNGAGKSTLFLHMNGILKPNKGELIYEGKKVGYHKKELKELRQRVGILFQDPDHQIFSASVYEDVSFGVVNLGLQIQEIRIRVDTALEQLNITHLKDKAVHSLSYGQKKKVALAGILAMRPSVLILDEPTAGLDPKGITDMMHAIKGIQEELNIAVVLSTHDIDIVPIYCDEVCIMDQGKLIKQGTPKEVFENPKQMRGANLRLPRITHLFELLSKYDHMKFDGIATTISEARRQLKTYKYKE